MNQSVPDPYAAFFKAPNTVQGRLFVGVKTTGIFCRPGCSARHPKPENCSFYPTAKEALSAGYRACRRCHPMRMPGEAPSIVKTLIELIETDMERRWSEKDLKARAIDPSTARRQFKKRFDMTFSQYARARRLGAAVTTLKSGDSVINAQLTAGYNSASGFRAAFSDRFGQSPKNLSQDPLLIEWIDTPLGPMIAICDNVALYLLEFTARKHLDRQVERLSKTHKRAILPGRTVITESIATELNGYFKGTVTRFDTPLAPTGTEFQKSVWKALCKIPYGETITYAQLAENIGNPKAVRAVASSNASNGLALIIPCHRVIATGGGLGGYAGGLNSKSYLLNMERRYKPAQTRT